MGIPKGRPHRCQAINVRRTGLRIAFQMGDPVIEIVDGDEEHIGAVRRHRRLEETADQQENKSVFHEWTD